MMTDADARRRAEDVTRHAEEIARLTQRVEDEIALHAQNAQAYTAEIARLTNAVDNWRETSQEFCDEITRLGRLNQYYQDECLKHQVRADRLQAALRAIKSDLHDGKERDADRATIDILMEQGEALARERDVAHEEIARLTKDRNQWQQAAQMQQKDRFAAEGTVARLRAALQKYGIHDPTCSAMWGNACRCGFSSTVECL
jgi:chromosome segregation ATPase